MRRGRRCPSLVHNPAVTTAGRARWAGRLAPALACGLLAAAARLPAIAARGLTQEEKAGFVTSQGLDPEAMPRGGQAVDAAGFRRAVSALASARLSPRDPVPTLVLAAWTRVAGLSEPALRLPFALAGAACAALAAAAGGAVGGAGIAWLAGMLLALSPLLTAASIEIGPDPVHALLVCASLWAVLRAERAGGWRPAVLLGLTAGLLLGSGVIGPVALALLSLAWLAWPRERRGEAGLSAASAAATLLLLAALGLSRSPLHPLDTPAWVPQTTVSGLLRCTGASLTRVAGIEYHLLVPHARYALPATLAFAALAVAGARRIRPRLAVLLACGALLPPVLAMAGALALGRVTPLQAHRLLPALPFVALLMAVGTGTLAGARCRLASALGMAVVATGLTLVLAAPGDPTPPLRATAEVVTRCLPPRALVTVRRPLDAVALAAWGVAGPFSHRAAPDAPAPSRAIEVSWLGPCAHGLACLGVPPCATR
jgi:hypothetical protein